MPRKTRSIHIDRRVIDALDKESLRLGISTNQLIEQLGFMYCKLAGLIPFEAEPLGEKRGGDRTKKD